MRRRIQSRIGFIGLLGRDVLCVVTARVCGIIYFINLVGSESENYDEKYALTTFFP